MPRLTLLRLIGGAAAAGILVLVAAGLVLAALLAWCSPRFERSDLVGVYVAEYTTWTERPAEYPGGTEKLTLNADGAFLQEVTLKEPAGSTPITRAGSWTWDESAQLLWLDNCMPVNDGCGNINLTFQTNASGCIFPATREWRFFGQLLLGDESRFLRKVQ